MRNVHRAAILDAAILHCHYHGRVANSAAAVIMKRRRVEGNFKGGGEGEMRTPGDRAEQKPKYSKLGQQGLHSSHWLWKLLTLLANTSLAWVNWVKKNTC